MTEVAIVPAEDWHALVIADDPRPADVQELAALGTSPFPAMQAGMRASVARTGMVNGVPVCMFGASSYSILGGIGVPWLVAAAGMDTMTAHKALLRESRGAVAEMKRRFPTLLFNVVDERNEAARRWLRWLGFQFQPEPIRLGRGGEPFRVFYMR